MEKYSNYTAIVHHKDGQTHVNFPLPKTCIHCNETMTPEVIHKANPSKDYIALLLRCSSCKEFFATSYTVKYDDYSREYVGQLVPYSYNVKIIYDLPLELEEFSPIFKEIYTQSQIAEAYNLTHIAGIGYRKSLEFLIKDFLIKVKQLPNQDVENLFLSPAIDKLDNRLISASAKAATWIANDETHYVRKHSDKDVSDIKRYLRSVAHLLSAEYIALDGQSFINESSSSKSN